MRVLSLTGEILTVGVKPEDTVMELKNKIQQTQGGGPPVEFVLLQEDLLEDTEKLAHYNATSDDVFELGQLLHRSSLDV